MDFSVRAAFLMSIQRSTLLSSTACRISFVRGIQTMMGNSTLRNLPATSRNANANCC